jgi:peptidoglycan/LPS O-acetylase OafA/YrhL
VPHVEHHVQAYSSYFSPLDRAAELLLGCAGAVAWRNRLLTIPSRWPALQGGWGGVQRTLSKWRSLLCVALAVAFLGLLFVRPDVDPRSVYLSANVLAVPLIVTLLSAPGCLLAKLIGCRPLRYVGKISYCLYLCHLMVRNLLYHYLPGRPLYFYVLLTFVFSFAIAGASWRILEARILGTRRSPRIARIARQSLA